MKAIRERLVKPWIVEYEPWLLLRKFDYYTELFDGLRSRLGRTPSVVIAEQDSLSFLLAFLAGVACQCRLVLVNQTWSRRQIEQVSCFLTVDEIIGNIIWPVGDTLWQSDIDISASILLPTGGSGGRLRFAIHQWQHVLCVVEGYTQFWKTVELNTVNVLPLYHAGGLVPVLRSFVRGGKLVLGDWKGMHRDGIFPEIPKRGHLSIVPAQLQRLLAFEGGAQWLRRFEAVLIGGAASPDALLAQAIKLQIPIVRAYGMTEALGTVALQICHSLSDLEKSATVLPHLEARVVDSEIQLRGEGLFEGYLPGELHSREWFASGDFGEMDSSNRIRVKGRKDRMIISGGENIDPVTIESAILQQGLAQQALVLGIDDPKWGQRVVAFLVGVGASVTATSLIERIGNEVPRYAIPKQWIFVDALPLTETGKMHHLRLEQTLLKQEKIDSAES